MKKLNNVKWFTLGIVVTLLLSIGIPALASQLTKTATLTYNDIKITLDGKAVTPKDAAGNTVEPFIIDGTTYLPVRAVAGALGVGVDWDSATNTVKLSTSNTVAEKTYKVERVVDGDTIQLTYNGATETVRLIGVDTPESVHPTAAKNTEFGKLASGFTSNALLGKDVELEFDVSERDKYGRLLAYVWLDGVLFNELLVEKGYAQVATYPPDVKYVDRFTAAQELAREAGAGLWGYEEPLPTTTPSSEPTAGNVYVTSSGTKYHSTPTCSNMNSPQAISKDYAISHGYTACSKCW